MEIIFGTGNDAKIAYMERALRDFPFRITGLRQAAQERGILLPQVEETGLSVLENARLKAESYFAVFERPVFSCDSGIYLWNQNTGLPLPSEEQPGLYVRGRRAKRIGDEELLEYHIHLVKKYGSIRARYQNAICLIWDRETRAESMEESLWGEPFLLTDLPHAKRVEGFPLDSISLEYKTQKYFYDLGENSQDRLVSHDGFASFFRDFLQRNRVL